MNTTDINVHASSGRVTDCEAGGSFIVSESYWTGEFRRTVGFRLNRQADVDETRHVAGNRQQDGLQIAHLSGVFPHHFVILCDSRKVRWVALLFLLVNRAVNSVHATLSAA